MTPTILKQISTESHNGISESQKIQLISNHISSILKILGLDTEDESLRDTPYRVAKMYVQEVFNGLNPQLKPEMVLFENKNGYKEMLVEKNITFFSYCEHHLVPFFGKAHVAYFPRNYIVGLSKLNRLVQYLARKPHVQERLTVEIGKELQVSLQTGDVAVVLEGTHLCIASRGVEDVNSVTRTSFFSGRFDERETRDEFLAQIQYER